MRLAYGFKKPVEQLLQGLLSSFDPFGRMPYYAVAVGREVGVFNTWTECERQVKGFGKPKFKKFKTRQEADNFLKDNGLVKDKEDSSKYIFLHKNYEDDVKEVKVAKDFWPDDVELCDFNADDDEDLISGLAEVEEIAESNLSIVMSSYPECFKEHTSTDGPSPSKKSKSDCKIWEPIGLKRFGPYEFSIDSEGFVIVYTDGSCFNNGQKNCVAGFGVYFGKDHPLNAAKPVKGRITNNAGEIQASIYAIQVAKDLGIQKLCLSTDSQFLINSITLWIRSWKARGWRLKSGEPVKNVDDFKTLDDLLDGSIRIKWNYVKGHNGIEGNVMADKLARRGSEIYRETNFK